MNSGALQRVVVRMLYDPGLVQRVYEDAAAATRDCGIEATEASWLTAPDRRAWGVDPMRRARSLTGLLEEFCVSAARVVRAGEDATSLDAFFSSEDFHVGMQRGESLAEIFASWLADSMRRQGIATAVLDLELAFARVRRATSPPLPAGQLVLAPGVLALCLPTGTLGDYVEDLETLRAHTHGPVAAAVDRAIVLPEREAASDLEGLLVKADGQVETMSADLAGVLACAQEPIGFEQFCARAAEFGADPDDSRSILESFAEDHLVRGIESLP